MKTLVNHLSLKIIKSGIRQYILLFFSILLMWVLMYPISGCMYYFKAKEKDINDSETQAELNLKGKYVILHNKGQTRNLFNIEVKDEFMSGRLQPVSIDHRNNLVLTRKGGNRYKKKTESNVIDEVHIFVDDNLQIASKLETSFPISSIEKMYFYGKDNAATVSSWVIPPVLFIGTAVAISAASSCPYLYSYNGSSYDLVGELFGGATYSALERHDYMPLTEITDINGSFRFKLVNELEEIQFTNLCDLIEVRHPENVKVLIDKNGDMQTILSPQPPRRAITNNNNDLTLEVREKDHIVFGFDDKGAKHAVNSLILNFKNTNNARYGKLILRAKNTVWADYAYGNFTRLFGTYYKEWDTEQKNLSKKKLIKNILEQDIPLSVYLETKKGWKFVDFFDVVGPLAYREIVLPINLSKAKPESIRIKLESGYKFWELDYAAMDFSEPLTVEYSSLPLISAIDEQNNDLKETLLYDDDDYLVQNEIGNEVELNYAVDAESYENKDFTQKSYFFHSKGYYERIREYQNEPDWITLIMHKHKHAFSKYSKNEYKKELMQRGLALDK